MELAPSTRAFFRFVVTSDAVNASYMITTPLFRKIESEEALDAYLRRSQFQYCTKFNRDHGVSDFRPMTAEEAELFYTGKHPHSPPITEGFNNENTSVRH